MTVTMTINTGKTKHKSLIWLLLFGIAAFNIADYFLTLYALKNGFREGNLFVDLIVDTVLFAKLKLLIVPLLLVFIWVRSKYVGNRLYLYVWIAFLAYLFLMLYYALLFWDISR